MNISLLLGSAGSFLAVALGAFAAHGLKGTFDEYHMSVFRTGVEYQFLHSLALVLLAALAGKADASLLRYATYAFAAGILIFSGSLYALAFTKVKMWGAVTPFGGVSFLIGWALVFMAAWRKGS